MIFSSRDSPCLLAGFWSKGDITAIQLGTLQACGWDEVFLRFSLHFVHIHCYRSPSMCPNRLDHFSKTLPAPRWDLNSNFCFLDTKGLQKTLLYCAAISCVAFQSPAFHSLVSAQATRLTFLSLSSLCNLDYLNVFFLGNTKLQFLSLQPC